MELNYNIKAELDTSKNAEQPVWSDLGKTMTNLTMSLNEVMTQYSRLADNGWGSTEVTGGQFTVTFTGHKVEGDPVSDYIFSNDVEYKFGDARKTKMRLVWGTKAIVCDVTLANITEGGGDAQQPNAITLTVHGNGAPTFETIS